MNVATLYNQAAINIVFMQAREKFGESFAFLELLKGGMNPNLRNPEGETLLHEAVFHQRKEIAILLLTYGADPNDRARNKSRMTPAHIAASQKDEEMVQLLAKHGADLTLKDNNGWSPDRPWDDCYMRTGSPPHGLGVYIRPEWRQNHMPG